MDPSHFKLIEKDAVAKFLIGLLGLIAHRHKLQPSQKQKPNSLFF